MNKEFNFFFENLYKVQNIVRKEKNGYKDLKNNNLKPIGLKSDNML